MAGGNDWGWRVHGEQIECARRRELLDMANRIHRDQNRLFTTERLLDDLAQASGVLLNQQPIFVPIKRRIGEQDIDFVRQDRTSG
jgi:hypothetical protein